MRTISRLNLRNWKCFRGEHELALLPGVYAVAARDEGNPERSNWLGKSSFLVAILFALTGKHSSEDGLADGWISRGEKQGLVELWLEVVGVPRSLVEISRSRVRGEATVLVVKELLPEGGIKESQGDDAQSRIDELVGIPAGDLEATRLLRQKGADALVRMRPGERTDLVSGWLDLGPLQEAADKDRSELRALLDRAKAIRTEVEILDRQLLGARALQIPEDEERRHTEEAQALRARAAEIHRSQVEAARLEGLRRDKARFDQLDEQGRKLRAENDALDVGKYQADRERVAEKLAKATGKLAQVEAERREVEKLAGGKFDGRCPAMRRPCPVAADVRRTCEGDTDRLRIVAEKVGKAAEAAKDLRGREAALAQVISGHARTEERLATMREEAIRIVPSLEELEQYEASAKDGPATAALAVRENADELLRRATSIDSEVAGSRQVARRVAETELRLGEKRQELLALDPPTKTLRESLAVFGPGGAQRRAAEGALAEIEGRANDLLASLGSGLSVAVRWARENDRELADACADCGAPFPKSKREKVCTTCGAERGPKVTQRLDLVPSRRSGGADDLAGIAFALGAGTMLLAERGSDWGVATLDEPFGALDAHNRRELAAHLGQIVSSEHRIAQLFVVAHERGVIAALPRRISIVSEGGWSRIELGD